MLSTLLIESTIETSVQSITPALYGKRPLVSSSKKLPTDEVSAIAVVRQAKPIARATAIAPKRPNTEWEIYNSKSVRETSLSVR